VVDPGETLALVGQSGDDTRRVIVETPTITTLFASVYADPAHRSASFARLDPASKHGNELRRPTDRYSRSTSTRAPWRPNWIKAPPVTTIRSPSISMRMYLFMHSGNSEDSAIAPRRPQRTRGSAHEIGPNSTLLDNTPSLLLVILHEAAHALLFERLAPRPTWLLSPGRVLPQNRAYGAGRQVPEQVLRLD